MGGWEDGRTGGRLGVAAEVTGDAGRVAMGLLPVRAAIRPSGLDRGKMRKVTAAMDGSQASRARLHGS